MQWYLTATLFIHFAFADNEQSNDANDDDTEVNPTAEEIESANEEIIVYGQREVDRRRAVLDDRLESNGYRKGIRKGNKVVYRPETVWHPSVIVYDSGWVDLRKTPPRFEPWIGGRPDNKWRYLSCIPPFGLMCIKASGWLITKRRAQHSKTAVVDDNIETIQYWQASVQGLALQNRMDIDLPNQLDAIWNDESLAALDRSQQIIELWLTRTCTPEGNLAAAVVADFLSYEVFPEHPMTSTQLQYISDNNTCKRKLPGID